MSKRIKQNFVDRRVTTFTTGTPRGNLPNFDVSITSPENVSQHRPTELTLKFVSGGKNRTLVFDGRQSRTLYEVLSRHFEQL